MKGVILGGGSNELEWPWPILQSQHKIIIFPPFLNLNVIIILNQKFMKKSIFIIFFYYLKIMVCQYTLSIATPFLLTNNYTNITTINNDLQNQFLVGFYDGTARRYSSDFSAYTVLPVGEVVNQFSSWSLQLNNIILSNGTLFSMLYNMTISLSNTYTLLRVYSYPAFAQVINYTFTQPILDHRGFPLYVAPNFTPFHVLVFNQTIKIAFKGAVYTAFNISQAFGAGYYCSAVVFNQWSLSWGGDYLNFTFSYYQTIRTVGLVQVNIITNFKFNFTSATYEVSTSSNFAVKANLAQEVRAMFLSNGVVLMQTQSLFNLILYSGFATNQTYMDPNIQMNSIVSFFYIFNTYYILYTAGLVSAKINTFSSSFISTALVNTLPNSSYALTFATTFDVLYIIGGPYIYKSRCVNQTFNPINSAFCSSYTCSVSNCQLCPLTSTTCGTCNTGFTRTNLYTCTPTVSNATNTTNVTNTNGSNTVNTTNTTSTSNTTNGTNTTNNTSTSNTTNSTSTSNTTSNSSSSINQTNNTNSTSGGVNTTNSTWDNTLIDDPILYYTAFPLLQQLQWLLSLFWMLVDATKTMISVPALRRVSPTFFYFGNFDDIYLYYFHDRLYGNIMSQLFAQLNEIQNKKWSFFSYASELTLLDIDSDAFYTYIDYQDQYSSYNFTTPDHQQVGPEALIANGANFFIVSAPITLLLFLMVRLLFRLTYQYPISQLLRKFDLWGYLPLLLFDGNIQQFAFYTTSEWQHIFFFEGSQKVIKLGSLLFGVMMVIGSTGGYLLTYGFYGKINRYLIDNNKNCLSGNAYILLQYGLRNLILGILHSVLRPLEYQTMLGILFSVEVTFFIIFVVSVFAKSYKIVSFIWFYLALTLIRIILIFTLFWDYEAENADMIELAQCTLIIVMILVYLLGSVVALLYFIVQVATLLIKIVNCRSMRKPQSLQFKVPSQLSLKNGKRQTSFIKIQQKTVKESTTKFQRVPFKSRKLKTTYTIHKTTLKIVEVDGGIKSFNKKQTLS